MTSSFVGIGVLIAVAACSSTNGSHGDDAPPDAATDASADAAIVGAWTADPPCTATADAIYTTPAQLPAARGAIIKCALGDKLDQATVQSEMNAAGAEGVVAQTGARVVKISYRTVRSDGSAAATTATVYLPLVPRAVPAPVVLIGRPTSGIADTCAPSKKPRPERNLALPFAARGFVTITPDFAGLGNEGTHAYLDNHEAVSELFDGAKALKALVPGNVVGDPVGAVGYSQGGGVVLSAQALEHATTSARTLKGIAVLAPQWPISTKSFGYEDVLRNPDRFTALAGLAPATVTVLRHYGYFMNKVGAQNGGDAFPAAERSSIIGSIESLCTVALGGALDANQTRLRELVDETFRTSMLACIDGGAGCTGRAQQFHQWVTNDFVTADPQGARVLVVQGLADQVMPAAGEAACGVAKLRAEGVQPEICSDSTATHDTVLERRIENVVAWIEAVATGVAAPACGSQTLPACNR
ncbi:MAG: alpha/beta fold hydrolase [Myxococcota bacterium]|nr:alpha/beta fold hydrolase [Myxococcota bacterium]